MIVSASDIEQKLDELLSSKNNSEIKDIIKKLYEYANQDIELLVKIAINRIDSNNFDGSKWSTLAFSLIASIDNITIGRILQKLVEHDDSNPAYLNNYGSFLFIQHDAKSLEYFARAYAIDYKHRGHESSKELPAWKNLLNLEKLLQNAFDKKE